MIYMVEPLSQFRVHAGQQQKQAGTLLACMIRWALEIQYAWKNKTFLVSDDDMKMTSVGFYHHFPYIMKACYAQNYRGVSLDIFKYLMSYFLQASSGDCALDFDINELIRKYEKPPIMVTRAFLPPMEEYVEEVRDLWQPHWITNMGVKHQTLEEEIGRAHV